MNSANAERAAKQRRLAAMAEAVAAYEAEYGEITAEEMAAQRRADRLAAVRVAPEPGRSTAPRPRRPTP